MRPATGAGVWRAHLDFKWRDQRSDKLELTDGTNVFAKARAAKERINGKCDKEIVEDQPRRPDWLVPETEDFVAPKEQDKQRDGKPL